MFLEHYLIAININIAITVVAILLLLLRIFDVVGNSKAKRILNRFQPNWLQLDISIVLFVVRIAIDYVSEYLLRAYKPRT